MTKKFAFQVTFFQHNFGSVLQAYALKEFLKSYNIDLFLISENYSNIERFKIGIKRRYDFFIRSIIFPEIKVERQQQSEANKESLNSINEEVDNKIDSFISKKLNIAKLSYKEMRRKSYKKECVFCIAGSDQIWNGSRVYLNPFYFLSFAPKNKRISFASSFGCTEVKRYNSIAYKRHIKTFDKISVREKSGLKIVNKLCHRKADWIMDPVMLLSSSDWHLDSCNDDNELPDDYMFVFFLNKPNNKAQKHIESYYKSGHKIVTIGYESNIKGLNISLDVVIGGPEDFLRLIQKAKIVCTDSFHATVFSLIFGKTFYTYERNYINSNQNERLISLLQSVNMIDRYDPSSFDFRSIEKERFILFNELADENKRNVIRYLNV